MENETNGTAAGAATNDAPISMWGYFGYEILFSLPVIGWIILIVQAVSAKNVNVKNFARSYFCLLIVFAIVGAIAIVPAIKNFMYYY